MSAWHRPSPRHGLATAHRNPSGGSRSTHSPFTEISTEVHEVALRLPQRWPSTTGTAPQPPSREHTPVRHGDGFGQRRGNATQPRTVSQTSTVQGSSSSHATGWPTHSPLRQRPSKRHRSLSPHETPLVLGSNTHWLVRRLKRSVEHSLAWPQSGGSRKVTASGTSSTVWPSSTSRTTPSFAPASFEVALTSMGLSPGASVSVDGAEKTAPSRTTSTVAEPRESLMMVSGAVTVVCVQGRPRSSWVGAARSLSSMGVTVGGRQVHPQPMAMTRSHTRRTPRKRAQRPDRHYPARSR